jgi:sulfoxide reductase heme-binding subunit YedZ
MGVVERINALARRVPACTIYMGGLAPVLWLFWQGAAGGLGADPVKAIERELGETALQLLVAGLCITPLRRLAGVNLLKFRRALGLTAFGYVLVHFLTWVVLDMGLLLGQALADIVKRPYVTVGMAGLVLLLPLALTSNDWSVRRLGAARWRKLHRLVYAAALAGAVHYLWLVKSWPLEPFLYLGAILFLLALRLRGGPLLARLRDSGEILRMNRRSARLTGRRP